MFDFETDDPKTGDMINFSAELTIVGKPTLAITASTGMSALSAVDSTGALTLFPTFAIGTFQYTATTSAAATWVKFTPTAASHTITINSYTNAGVLLETTSVTSGNQSSAMVSTDATIVKYIITVQETGKSAKNYTIFVSNPA